VTDPVSALSAVTGVAKAIDPDGKTADLSTSLWGDVLGPPAKALGRHFERQVERWSESAEAKRVLKLAAQKSDTSAPGSVPPRVAAAVLEAAQYSDDEFVAEYLSGVLASSRTPDGKDDRGVAWSALVGRLSSDALKLHYALYSFLRGKMRGQDADVVSEWCRRHIVMRYMDLLPALGLSVSDEGAQRTLDAAYALQREGLIEKLTHGTADHLTGHPYGQYALPEAHGMLIVTTSIQGIQLFLQGHGYGGVWASAIAEPDRSFEAVGDVDERLGQVEGMFLEELPRR
jgi:hypothetical protein